MTGDQFRLLLAVARILRANIADEADGKRDYGDRNDDLDALNEALAPFDSAPQEPINEQS
jgi:hypothetical protein